MSHRTSAIESFKNSLRWCLRWQCHNLTEHKVRTGEFFLTAPLSELAPYTDVAMPMTLELLVDLEFGDKIERLWFELDFVRINRTYLTAVYRAACDC